MQYARLPVGKSRKNRVTDKESEGFAFFCTNLNDWGMSDIFNSSHFLRALMKSYQASQENQGAAEISWGSRGKSIAHCKYLDFTFLPFTFLPFEGEDGGPGRGELTLRLLEQRGERFLNEGVFRCFGFDNVRTSQLQTASQEQSNGEMPL